MRAKGLGFRVQGLRVVKAGETPEGLYKLLTWSGRPTKEGWTKGF